MEPTKVLEWVDIKAPRAEVFELITNIERRMQLSPLWGSVRVEARPEDYPQVGSAYLVRHKLAADENGSSGELLAGQAAAETHPYQTVVTEYEPPRKFAYCLDVDRQTTVAWTLQEIQQGTRLSYQEEYLVDPADAEAFNESVRKIIKSWLNNIRHYSELRETRFKRFVRWVLDKYFLKLRQEQRTVVALILFMHFTGIIAFVMAAFGMGLFSLLFN